MRRFSTYLGLAFAACMACFSVSALAEPVLYAQRMFIAAAELPGVGLKRLDLTLAMWRTGGHATDESLKSNLRASSNHFVMSSASPVPDGVGHALC
ncbi:hypothetical protein M2401_000823 [Pseudomonas sp. JUb42]|uniref:hypothetical protein n=1 Tax=Pseudomonas sp. JUb42 TaxID=2940611 RepID=UPI00216820BC|nr:hypothetical protein [Pseudomonas sp. JUb42]MCS3467102.1 hypothetical protein [Pseudomonas sp. JUb42]